MYVHTHIYIYASKRHPAKEKAHVACSFEHEKLSSAARTLLPRLQFAPKVDAHTQLCLVWYATVASRHHDDSYHASPGTQARSLSRRKANPFPFSLPLTREVTRRPRPDNC